MNINNFIALGGCHLNGYGIDEKKSFIRIIEKNAGIKCSFIKAHFQIKKTEELISIINTTSAHLVILQLGNYEFSPNLNKLFSQSKVKSSNSVSVNESLSGGFYENQKLVHRIFTDTFRFLLIPIFNIKLKNENFDNLLLIKKIIKEHNDKKFIIITPFPYYRTLINYFRKRANNLFNKIFIDIDNVILIDSFFVIKYSRTLFLNQGHLNEFGHKLLGEFICDKIKEIEKTKN